SRDVWAGGLGARGRHRRDPDGRRARLGRARGPTRRRRGGVRRAAGDRLEPPLREARRRRAGPRRGRGADHRARPLAGQKKERLSALLFNSWGPRPYMTFSSSSRRRRPRRRGAAGPCAKVEGPSTVVAMCVYPWASSSWAFRWLAASRRASIESCGATRKTTSQSWLARQGSPEVFIASRTLTDFALFRRF